MKTITPYFHKALLDKIDELEATLQPYIDKEPDCGTKEMVGTLVEVLQYKQQLNESYATIRLRLSELEGMIDKYFELHTATRVRMRRYQNLIACVRNTNNKA